MAKVIAISNQKGGVGKTTTSIQLAYLLSDQNCGYGFKILGIDADNQGSWSNTLGLNRGEPGLYELVVNQMDCRIQINENFDFISCTKASSIFNALVKEPLSEIRLSDCLHDWCDLYDYIIIDCPPQDEFLNSLAYAAANEVIIPIESGRFSLEGVVEMQKRVNVIKRFNQDITFGGLLICNVNKRTRAYKNILEDASICAQKLETKVYESTISKSSVVNDAEANYKSLFEYAPKSKVTHDYAKFIEEVVGYERTER